MALLSMTFCLGLFFILYGELLSESCNRVSTKNSAFFVLLRVKPEIASSLSSELESQSGLACNPRCFLGFALLI